QNSHIPHLHLVPFELLNLFSGGYIPEPEASPRVILIADEEELTIRGEGEGRPPNCESWRDRTCARNPCSLGPASHSQNNQSPGFHDIQLLKIAHPELATRSVPCWPWTGPKSSLMKRFGPAGSSFLVPSAIPSSRWSSYSTAFPQTFLGQP